MKRIKNRFIFATLFIVIISFYIYLIYVKILPKKSPHDDIKEFPKTIPNVIIITIDTLRADHVGCYGYYRNTTPNIDNFSKDAVIFKNAVSQEPSTVGSMSSFITSKYSNTHILVKFPVVDMGFVILNRRYSTLGQILKREKYLTCFISDQPTMFYIKGLKKGFDTFIKTDINPALVTTTALKWITDNKNKPFFIWMHYEGAHGPYYPNKAFELKTPLKTEDKIVPLGKDDSEIFGVIPTSATQQQDTSNSLNYYINHYDGKILLTDEQIGVLLDGIKKLGLDKKSIIVVTSDHGEEFGEHDLYCSHGRLLYNTLLHVPLLIKFPSQAPVGKAINDTVGLIDVIPTVLDFLKIKEQGFDGETLVSLINNKTESKCIFSGMGMLDQACVTYKGWKLIRRSNIPRINRMLLAKGDYISSILREYELYNLETDTYEQDDLSENKPEVLNELKDILRKFEKKNTQEIVSQRLNLFQERADGEIPGTEVPDQEIEKLKELGYMN